MLHEAENRKSHTVVDQSRSKDGNRTRQHPHDMDAGDDDTWRIGSVRSRCCLSGGVVVGLLRSLLGRLWFSWELGEGLDNIRDNLLAQEGLPVILPPPCQRRNRLQSTFAHPESMNEEAVLTGITELGEGVVILNRHLGIGLGCPVTGLGCVLDGRVSMF